MIDRTWGIRGRLEFAGNVIDACRRMGAEWVLFRLRYASERKLGLHERRSPVKAWPEPAGYLTALPEVVRPEALRMWLRENATQNQRLYSQSLVDRLRRREFDVFGAIVRIESWHHDPVHDVCYESSVHWSKVAEFERVDVKCVWEPSRFGWAFGLARAEHLGVEGAAELFWELLESWMEENAPNAGIQWACGQEASIRLMAVSLAAMAMPDSWSPGRLALIEQLIEVTADRVEANIAYARSQRNNHHASEAVGLVACALMLPGHPRALRWLDQGTKHLTEVANVLILEDGGSSQYSTNYHRVFLHNFVWVAALSEAVGHDLGRDFQEAFRRASEYLLAFMEPQSGHGPFIGHDDGAELLPAFCQPHRLLGPDVQLLRAYFEMPRAVGPEIWDEWLAWFGLEYGPGDPVGGHPGPGYRHFPKMGIVIMWAGPHRIYVRCGPFEFRPSQADQLHVDVWEDGVNLVGDPGTFSYRPRPGELGLLDSAFDHNTITLHGRDHMPKVGRFLFARWAEGRVLTLTCDHGEVVGEFECVTGSGRIHRVVKLSREGPFVSEGAIEGNPPEVDSYRQYRSRGS